MKRFLKHLKCSTFIKFVFSYGDANSLFCINIGLGCFFLHKRKLIISSWGIPAPQSQCCLFSCLKNVQRFSLNVNAKAAPCLLWSF